MTAPTTTEPPTQRPDTTGPAPLTRLQKSLIGTVASGALIIAGIGFTGSYAAVTALAKAKHFGTFAYAFPIGIDAGIVVLLALDLILTWLRMTYPLLRQAAWALTGATIAFNAAAAWGDPIAVGMHAAIPALFVVITEAARHAVGRIADITAERHIESPPLIRWIIAPVPTYRIWRRMRMWHIPSYVQVIEQQKQIKVFRAGLRTAHGKKWKRTAPAEKLLVFELATYGIPVAEALAMPEKEEAARRAVAEEQARTIAAAEADARRAAEEEATERARQEAERNRIAAEADAERRRLAEAERTALLEEEHRRALAEAETRAKVAEIEQRQRAVEAEAEAGRRSAERQRRDVEAAFEEQRRDRESAAETRRLADQTEAARRLAEAQREAAAAAAENRDSQIAAQRAAEGREVADRLAATARRDLETRKTETGAETGTETRRRAETKTGTVAVIGDRETETATLLGLMRERGDRMKVSLDEAIRETGRPKATAAKRLKTARDLYLSETA